MKKEKSIYKVDPKTGDKKQLFIDATICALAEYGYKGTTVRKIAEIAKVAPGLLTHYYSGKEVLIAESYKYLAYKFLDLFRERVAEHKDNPLEALNIFFLKTFERGNMDPRLLRIWLSFWSLTLLRRDLGHIHRETYQQYIEAIEEMLSKAYELAGRQLERQKVRHQAIGVNALLDGLWLEWCLNPDTFSREDGLSIVYDFVESATGLVLEKDLSRLD
ncbi:TetR family transcriptional regulator C-terminal domain-containing protein [Emcibacter nanhaiensis]|uniref:TetR family transcriptional regulator n=1 Tax=Emcibacter nanhaiensis TaxID=1505037 RepID=A0A501PJR9_9PROT|nr:TetR family transcriptional regulator C-terminal domain-containing protein [Emcibacter nanhaiensis]TPD60750.1 TetR family transcriptional regulator [Emcibacter nanhaiensis]